MTTEIWTSCDDEAVTAEYSVERSELGGHYGDFYASVRETTVEIFGITVLGIPLKPDAVPLLVSKLKEEIRESIDD